MSGITGSVQELVESWKVEQCAVYKNPIIDESDPCHDHINRKEWSSNECSLLNTPGPNNPFSNCISKLDITQIQKSYIECMYDACSCDKGGDCLCLCSSLAAFSELCTSVGVPVKWRTQQRCPIQCEYGKEYLACGPLCSQTCMDLSTGNNPECDDSGCVEGCFCPEGTVVDYDGNCVESSQCECYRDNSRYPVGSQIINDCQICDCFNGVFNCSNNIKDPDCIEMCNNKTEFRCLDDNKCIPKEWICVILF